jgi:hypothetical protein
VDALTTLVNLLLTTDAVETLSLPTLMKLDMDLARLLSKELGTLGINADKTSLLNKPFMLMMTSLQISIAAHMKLL